MKSDNKSFNIYWIEKVEDKLGVCMLDGVI